MSRLSGLFKRTPKKSGPAELMPEPNPEVLDLKQRVLDADLSFQRPEMQKIVCRELEEWAESYNTKKRSEFYDCYGGPGKIPDTVNFAGASYTPNELYAHARERDEVGMALIAYLVTQQQCLGILEEGMDSRESTLQLVPDHADLDQVVTQCMCGEHQKTYRDILQDVIDVNPDSLTLALGWDNAIKSLYPRSSTQ